MVLFLFIVCGIVSLTFVLSLGLRPGFSSSLRFDLLLMNLSFVLGSPMFDSDFDLMTLSFVLDVPGETAVGEKKENPTVGKNHFLVFDLLKIPHGLF